MACGGYKTMNEKIEVLSIYGRVAYCMMCVEKYVKTKYGTNDLSCFENIFWSFSQKGQYLDKWAYRLLEIVPTYLFEYPDYATTKKKEGCSIDEGTFSKAREIFNKDDDVLSKLLNNAYDAAMVYSYTSIPGNGEDSMDICLDSVSILKELSIDLPSIPEMKPLMFETKNGWGEPFDYKQLSILFA